MNLFLLESLTSLAHTGTPFSFMVVFLAELFPYFLGAYALIYSFTGRSWREGLRIGIEVFLVASMASALAWMVKTLIGEPRPFLVVPGLTPLFYYGGFDGFPSGHTAFFTALGGALTLRSPHLGSLYLFFAVLIGLARVIAGVHWPFDILGGFVVGLLVSRVYVVAKERSHERAVHEAMLRARKELR